MTPPFDPEPHPEPSEGVADIVLRLGDILPRVPDYLLKPGPHDPGAKVRFSVEELAEKISRGRVSVPVERLASAFPEVFRDVAGFQGIEEIQLPLQKLLEQIGLAALRRGSQNGMPKDQLEQARDQAGRIIDAASTPPEAATQAPGEAPQVFSDSPEGISHRPAQVRPAAAPEPAEPPPAQPAGLARAFSAVRGLFSRGGESKAAAAPKGEPAAPKEGPAAPSAEKKQEPLSTTPAEPAAEVAPAGCISLRALPIFRLLPVDVLSYGPLPTEEVRLALPLAVIDPQLAEGHVEIPVVDFIKSLPERWRKMINAVEGATVWIPLDEIFQNLPPDHPFHMPPLAPLPSGEASSAPEPAAPAEAAGGKPAPEEPPRGEASAPVQEPPAANEKPPETQLPSAAPAPEPVTPTLPAEAAAAPVKDKTQQESAPEPPKAAPSKPPKAAPARPAAPPPKPAAPPPEPAAPPPEPAAPPPEPAAAPPAQPPSHAPWMRGFQIAPPLLFARPAATAAATPEPAVAEPAPGSAPTPEAKRTADFLASQPGIFAAAAFVQGAVFASADFPRKPDLDALREFMGSFVDTATESGRRLGWNRVVTIACEQFYATAVVRETHFVVALHHDRVLASVAHDALIGAADDLNKAGEGNANR